ncbi:hypothetical protein YDYSG_37900 [Paenibacillus tyrfis]|nr:hypothetical protein YDYSG_37900 [Paenibacillus tyrfis]
MKIYCRHPFNTTARVQRTKDCLINPDDPNNNHPGARDYNFPGMPYGEPVYAMESGVVADIRRGRQHCDTANCKMQANNVVIQAVDGDRWFTEYAHITPAPIYPPYLLNPRYPGHIGQLRPRPLMIGHRIQAGQLIGWVDNSGYTVGDQAHLHISRFQNLEHDGKSTYESLSNYIGHTCDWRIALVDTHYVPLECMSHSPTPGHPHPWHLLP